MSSTISTQYGGASYEIGVAVQTQQTAEVIVDVTETTPPADTVEISSPGTSGENPPPPPPRTTYQPATVSDRFRFEIQNGMFDPSQRYTPLATRFSSSATATYEARESLGQMPGQHGVYSAIFDLEYQAAQPNPTEAGSNIEARTTLNRMADQNLSLLNSL